MPTGCFNAAQTSGAYAPTVLKSKMNESIPSPILNLNLDLEPPLFVDVNGDSVDDDLDDEKRLRKKRYQPKYDNTSLAPIVNGSTPSEQEMIRHFVRMIRLFLLGQTVDEIDAEMPETRVKTVEGTNVHIHADAINRLREITNDLDPDKDFSSTKTTARENISEAMKRISATGLASKAKLKPR